MRLFVAAEPSDDVRAAVWAAAVRLRRRLEASGVTRGIRWVPAVNLHLTIWFLGEVSDSRASALLDALAPPLETPSFGIQLAGLGAFPPSGPPRVLWMGVTRGVGELASVHDEVGRRLQPWGFSQEGRAYSAHLTLARVKEPPHGRARAVLRAALQDAADAGTCRITDLMVFRSRTAPTGSVYERLLRVPLT